MTSADFQRLFRYNAWANARTYEYVKRMPAPPHDVLKLLAHNVLGQELWYARVTGDGAVPSDYWQALPLEESWQLELKMQELWNTFLLQADEAKLHARLDYVRLGKPCSNVVSDVLMHMITHSMYHRGQIAIAVRTAGGEPMPTDFVAAGREGGLD